MVDWGRGYGATTPSHLGSTPLGAVSSTNMSLFPTADRKCICQDFSKIDYRANNIRPCLVWGYTPLFMSEKMRRTTAHRVPSVPRFSSLSTALVSGTWWRHWVATRGFSLDGYLSHHSTLAQSTLYTGCFRWNSNYFRRWFYGLYRLSQFI
jgi:hypothetical protein